ncbi:3-dehydroquinate synthase [Prochlorococcus sp. MIT 1307]|uniref:3-dehydroquinate synthase n=1 Tax=Prochlorococcus sp. MIT 1307 TaxID=3096219 RepID=UPI002A75114D|nr:3-dehydroquinate synthase [Prochlorococcus sp. MIT 1307]
MKNTCLDILEVTDQSTRRIPVEISRKPYEIIIGKGILHRIGEELNKAGIKKGVKILVVTNSDVAEPYSDLFIKSLKESGYEPTLLIIKAGESQKNPSSISLIHDAAFAAKLERGSLMIAFGGGVVGDMTGFAAATWLRGVSVVQVPTTLLAMVDASIGGKTGVNHKGGKNLIGAFHQPKLVLIDPLTLKTLPVREFRAGMAEVIKYAVIGDTKLFSLLEKHNDLSDLIELDYETLEEIISRSCSSKANIVALDEHESGIRAILNYGHTLGHAIETLCGYGTWLHGEAVSIGMVAIGELAIQLGSWSEDDANRQKALLKKAGLPTTWPKLNIEDVCQSLLGDKKVKEGKICFIIPKKIGVVGIKDDVNISSIKECLSRISHLD